MSNGSKAGGGAGKKTGKGSKAAEADTAAEPHGSTSDSPGAAMAGAFGLPDVEAMLRGLNLPGLDVSAIVEAERKNLEALRAANEAVAEGWQALAEQQRAMLERAVERWQSLAGEGLPGSPTELMERQATLTREFFDEALSNMQSLAEIATQSQSKAFEVVRERFEERLKELSAGFDDRSS